MPAPLVPFALALAQQFAPMLIRHFTGSDKAGAVAEQVVGIAQTITGTATPDAALAQLKADPAKVLEFQAQAMILDADLEKAYLADRDSARKRDIELAKAGFRNRRADYMVLLDVVGIISGLVVMVFWRGELPGEVIGIISTVIGVFGAGLRDAHQFEFGSSRGSKEKDIALIQQRD
jgi:hypothetical protein